MQEELQSAAVALPTIESVTADALSDKDFLLIPALSKKICQCPDQNCKATHDYVQSGGVLLLTNSSSNHLIDAINSLFGFSMPEWLSQMVIVTQHQPLTPQMPLTLHSQSMHFYLAAIMILILNTSLPEGGKSIYHETRT